MVLIGAVYGVFLGFSAPDSTDVLHAYVPVMQFVRDM